MRKLWICTELDASFPKNTASGVRLKFDPGVDPEVRRACMAFLRWLRKEYTFPRRIVVHLCESETVITSGGEHASAIFWGPYDKRLAPNIRVSAGDYGQLLEARGKDNALACILHSIAHELGHYFQWLKDIPSSERQVKYYAREIVMDYADTREHP